jgi:hypothetical protein
VRRALVLLFALVALVVWQRTFLQPDTRIASGYVVTASTGINLERKFFFFLYHLDLFPVATDVPITSDTKEEAERLFHELPHQLRQDEGSTFRSGDRGRTYLYFVDAWINKRGLDASLIPAHSLAFVLALGALLTSFWSIRRTGAGIVLVALLGSDPFQLMCVYRQENVFSWAITTLAAVLAIHVPLLEKRKLARWYPWAAAIGTGALVAFVRNFRSEPTVVLFGCVLVYATATWLKKRTRLGLVIALFATLSIGTRVSISLIDHKLEESKAAVAAVGGSPYTGPVAYFHEFWHAIFCGLGDFDQKYGYQWNDRVAYHYAYPELSRLNPGRPLDPDEWMLPETYDPAGKYPVFFAEVPHYNEIIRDKVLGDIARDPLWFLGIVGRRASFTAIEAKPVGVSFGSTLLYLDGSHLVYACLPLFVFLTTSRRWAHAKLLLFSLPLSIAPLLVYSGGGMTNYSSIHIFGLFLFLVTLYDGVRNWRRGGPPRLSLGRR